MVPSALKLASRPILTGVNNGCTGVRNGRSRARSQGYSRSWGRLPLENGEVRIGRFRPPIHPRAADLPPPPIGTTVQTRYREFAVISTAERLLVTLVRSRMCSTMLFGGLVLQIVC